LATDETTFIVLISHYTVASVLGGAAGFIIAISIMHPKSWYNTLGRFFTSVFLAYSTAVPILDWLNLPLSFQLVLLTGTGIGVFGWFLVSVVLRTVANSKSYQELRDNFRNKK